MAQMTWDSDFAILCAQYASRPAVVDRNGTTSYAALFGSAAAIADRLVNSGVYPGSPVVIALPTGRLAVAASLGATLSGAAEVLFDPATSAHDLEHALQVTGAPIVVTAPDQELIPTASARRLQINAHDTAELHPRRWPRPRRHDWGRILFTSGTTGRPKGAVHTHFGRWLANAMLRLALPFRPSEDDRILLVTPFPHGASLLTYAFLYEGASVCLINGTNVPEILRVLRNGEANHFFAPPTVLAKLLKADPRGHYPAVRTIFTGTAAMPPALYRDARRAFGPVVRVTYGMTEIFNPVTVLQPRQTEALYASGNMEDGAPLGWPAPGVEISIRDESGGEVSQGPGEIHVRAPHMFAGYVTESGFSPHAQGTFHATGDIGCFDAKRGLLLLGRRHDVIKTGGYKVFPQEIEAALRADTSHPAITVVGIPSEYWGEIAVAAVEGGSDRILQMYARQAESLTKYKRPRAYLRVSALPRNSTGKIDRARLRALILESHQFVDGPHPVFQPRQV